MTTIVKDEDQMRHGQGWHNAVLVEQGGDYYVVSTAPAIFDIFPPNTVIVQAEDETGYVDLPNAEPIYEADDEDREAALAWLTERRPVQAVT